MDKLQNLCEPCIPEIKPEPVITEEELQPLCPPCSIDEEDTFIIPKPELVEVVTKGKSQDDIVNMFLNEKRCRIL